MIEAHVVLCLALFYSVFCRCVRMDASTHRPIRLVLWMLGTVAAIGLAAPLHWPHWTPDFFSLALLASVTAMQMVTAYYWSKSLPPAFTQADRPHVGFFSRGER